MSTGLIQMGTSDENAPVTINKNGKPKPLRASTNIIHAKTPRRIDNLIHDKSRRLPVEQLDEPLKKKQISTKTQKSNIKDNLTSKTSENATEHALKSSIKKKVTTSSSEKTDENDVSAMIKNAYDPLKDIYQFDEELFKRVMKLDLADDGIPPFDYSEPFEF